MNTKIKSLGILTITYLMATAAFAGGGDKTGGGGGGVIRENTVYVVDLVEAGVEKTPYFDPSIPENPEFSKQIAAALRNVPNVPVALISRKLNEIYTRFDRLVPMEAILMMQIFRWQMLDFSLVHIPDETPVVDVPVANQVQLAARTGGAVKLDEKLWAKLDPDNKAALIIHEALYALTLTKNSDDARAIVGYLFSSDFKNSDLDGFSNALNGHLHSVGTSVPLLSCSPGSQQVECSGSVGVASGFDLGESLSIRPQAVLNTMSDGPVALSTFYNYVQFGTTSDSFNVWEPSLDESNQAADDIQWYVPGKYNIEKIVQTYCTDMLKVLNGEDPIGVVGSTSGSINKAIHRTDIQSIEAVSSYEASMYELSLDQTGAFLSEVRHNYSFSVQLGNVLSADISEASCETAESEALQRATTQVNSLYYSH